MNKTTLFTLLFASFTLVLSISSKPLILLLGSESTNDFKHSIAQHFIADVRLDGYLQYDESTSNIVVLGRAENVEIFQWVGRNPHFSPVRIVPIESISSTVVIVCLKGTNEMSLDELRTLHALIYEINSGIAAIEIGSNVIQTSSLLKYSTFCWASAKLKPEMIDAPAHVILCNGAKPSAVESVMDVVPFVRKDQPLDLPLMPQHRFWPSMMVSASAEGEKKLRASKHTTQPANARHTRVYGKEKKKSDEAEEKIKKAETSAEADKIACKYRRSCYETGKLDLEAIQADKHSPPVSAQKIATPAAPIDPKELEKDELKARCKYRKSCYESGELPPIDAQPIFQQQQPPATSSHPTDDDDSEEDNFNEKKMKLKCKYRPACYAEVGIEMPGRKQVLVDPKVQQPKSKEGSKTQTLKVSSQAASRNERTNDGTIDKIACKYRKSCYTTGELDLQAIQQAKYAAPVSAQKAQSNAPVNRKDLSGDAFKLRCKYRKQCYETGELPPIETFASTIQQPKAHLTPKRDEPVDVDDLEEDELKLKCRYRKSCYETGVLPPIVEHVPIHKKPEVEKPALTNVADKKLACKYRKKCIEALQDGVEEVARSSPPVVEMPGEEDQERVEVKVEEITEEAQEVEKEGEAQIPVPIIVQKQQKRRRGKEEEAREKFSEQPKSGQSSAQESPAVSKKAKKPAESSAEAKKRDPRRYVNKFKTVGKYEKLPKMAEVEEKEEQKEEVEKAEEQSVEATNEDGEIDEQQEPDDEERDASIKQQIPIPTNIHEELHGSEEEPVNEDEDDEEEPAHADLLPAIPIDEHDELHEQVEPKPIEKDEDEDEEKAEDKPTEIKPPSPSTATFVPVVVRPLSDEEKLRCKYRKSCMQGVEPPPTPVRPSIQAKAPISSSRPADVDVRDYDEDVKLKCKYRKSCMQEMSGGEVNPSIIEQRKVDDEEEYNKDSKEIPPPLIHVNISNISKEDRERCKYRKSCYAGVEAPPTVARTTTQSKIPIAPPILLKKTAVIGKVLREKCNKYWLSCREHLGLQPKERAPIGPNGRRLCRKKRPEGSVSS